VAVDVAVGSLPEVVAEAVDSGGHDLVMVAADRNPESAAASRRIVRAASCAVWLVRPGFEGSCVLAALDLDADPDRNRLILDLARSQAEIQGGRVRVMYAWQVGHLDVLNRMGGEPLDRHAESELVLAVESAYRATIDELVGDGIDRGGVHLVDGSPGRSVVALASLYRVDLVVMGAGEAKAGSAELGPTAEQVLTECDASVLIVQGSGPPRTE
jgi:nucleotide-binding universal stress UspA family protein